VRNDLESTNK